MTKPNQNPIRRFRENHLDRLRDRQTNTQGHTQTYADTQTQTEGQTDNPLHSGSSAGYESYLVLEIRNFFVRAHKDA
jgi:hypothetical protein